MPNGAPSSLSRLPSIMTARRASFSAVSGSAFTNGCIASGKRAYEKKVPDRIHIGSITRFISPETASMVRDRKSTRLNSSHGYISYAVFCLKKKKKHNDKDCETKI